VTLIHHIKLRDVERLKHVFATYTLRGWIVPHWLAVLEKACSRAP
jgi:hypothetical protein